MEGGAQCSMVEWVGETRDSPSHTRVSVRLLAAALWRVEPQHGLEVRVGLCQIETASHLSCMITVASGASPAVELVSMRLPTRRSTILSRKDWL